MLNIGIISTFPPTQCGIATYATDIIDAIESVSTQLRYTKIELIPQGDDPRNKNYTIQSNCPDQYLKAAEFINKSNIDVVDLQHEFKIYGAPNGENVTAFIEHIKKPIVATLHTVSSNLNEEREKVFRNIVTRCNLLYVFSREAKEYLVEKYQKSGLAIKIIPHGVPAIQFKKTLEIADRKIIPESIIFLSAGHMRDVKGYDVALQALGVIKNEIPSFKYFILGSNHPQNETAESYRKMLIELSNKLNLPDNVIFINDYLKLEDFIKYIQLADICLLPYTRSEQSSSGVLALMIASGRPVVSTPFQFAKSCIDELSGVISESFNFSDFATAIKVVINKRSHWDKISRHNHDTGQSWNWGNVANQYINGYKNVKG